MHKFLSESCNRCCIQSWRHTNSSWCVYSECVHSHRSSILIDFITQIQIILINYLRTKKLCRYSTFYLGFFLISKKCDSVPHSVNIDSRLLCVRLKASGKKDKNHTSNSRDIHFDSIYRFAFTRWLSSFVFPLNLYNHGFDSFESWWDHQEEENSENRFQE